MTYDRNYTWSKEFENEVKMVAKIYDLDIIKISEISVDSIHLPAERRIKIGIQKALSKINLMNYGQEFGKSILLTSSKSSAYVDCKGWCLSDHVIGLEIEFCNIDQHTLVNLKQSFDRHFYNYKIVWTQLQL